MKKAVILLFLIGLFSCTKKQETTQPIVASITESVYASGILKSKDQYQVFANVNGIIEKVLVSEGDSVKVGTPLFSIQQTEQQINVANAAASAQFADYKSNQEKVRQAQLFMQVAADKLKQDSSLYFRQVAIWKQEIGSKTDLELRALNYENAKANYYAAKVNYQDLKKQLQLNDDQAKRTLAVAESRLKDYTVKSTINGVVYSIDKIKGTWVSAQMPLAVVGASHHFILEMQIDEYDILKIQLGQLVYVTMDAYKGQVFEARISKIYPLMDERSKTFTVEAIFEKAPNKLYPNITFEANIVLNTKTKTLLIPRAYLWNDTAVITKDQDTLRVETGLKDYNNVEILKGITQETVLQKPAL
jgi:multidrug efflux pump subunit AcrA (membrane-fusion protein)